MTRLLPILALLLGAGLARAQDVPPDTAEASGIDALLAPEVGAEPDTTAPTRRVPSLDLGVPVAPAAEGGLDQPVQLSARDSLRIVFGNRASEAADTTEAAGDVVSLYGDATATYEQATITAGVLRYLSASEVVQARPLSEAVGRPQFSDGQETFTGQEFDYNLTSQRGRVVGARTQIDDGFLLGGVLKQQNERVVFAQDAAYTTCDLDHPHYELEAGRLKVVDGERVFSGPVQLKLLGIPMPIILPFGYFPAAEGRRSGPLAVEYGQETNFGLFLDNLGWYWAISDYLDAQVAARIGTRGSFQLRGTARYARQYAYTGNVSLDVGRIRSGEPTDPDFAPRTPIGLRWSHNQTLPAGQRISASVNLQSVSQRLTEEAVSSQISQSTNSSVSYTQTWPGAGRSLNLSVQAYQDFANNRTTATLPNLSFSQQRRFPFRRGRDDRWYEKISVSYSNRASNAFAYQPLSDSTGISAIDALFSPSAFREGSGQDQPFDYDVVQTVPIQAAFAVPRYNLTLTPSLTYTETWTGSSQLRTLDEAENRVVTTSEPGFTAVRRFVASVAAATEFYGTFPIRIGSLDGIRHTVRPRATLSFEPDYGALGFIREVRRDTASTETIRYAIAAGLPVDPTQALSFGIENAFVARTAREDSTGEVQRTTSQILSLGITGGYNFTAEERPFRDLGVRFASQAYGVNASGNATYSFYAVDSLGVVTNETYLGETGRPLRLTQVGFRLGRSFRSRGGSRAPDVRPVVEAPLPGDLYDPSAFGARSAIVGYVDYSAPWSFSMDVSLNYRPSFREGVDDQTTATLGINQFNTRLTPNWSVTGSTGLDLVEVKPTVTRLGLRRDLHCWEMAIDWRPIGPVRGFSVSLYVKSGYLRDFLRLDVPRSVVRSLPL
ncbi:MAG: putative LPS assembly protein LptD [Bacteroidota bacterium]